MQAIKHIILDLGGVLVGIDYQKTITAFQNLGIYNFSQHFSQAVQSDFFADFECGRITETQFTETIQNWCSPSASKQNIIDAWNAMIENFSITNLRLVQQLSLHYDVCVLSNTNSIHERYINHLLQQQLSIPHLQCMVDKVFYSHHIQRRKPHVETFAYVLNHGQFKPENTLFIDDSKQHIEGAKTLGIQTILLENIADLPKHFRSPD